MADYYTVLKRAIAALPESSPQTRQAVYTRATDVLIGQLRGLDPPLPEEEIARHSEALAAVVARIESELAPPPPKLEPLPAPDFSDLPPVSQPDEPEPGPPPAATAPVPPAAGEATVRPRVKIAPQEAARKGEGRRKLILGTGVLVAVGSIAAAAFYLNRPTDPAAPQPPPTARSAPAETPQGPKIAERPGAEPGPAAQLPATPAPSAEPQAPAATPAPPPRPAPPPPAQPAPGARPDVGVAQRAVLYVENPQNPQATRVLQGRTVWRLEEQSAGQGRPLETVLRADVDIPEFGLGLVYTIRRNQDAAFPASHIIGIRFIRTGDVGDTDIQEIGVPQLKTEESERGAPLSAVTTPLGENLFVTALSRVDIEVARNLDLLTTRNWFDVPLLLKSGARAILTFEKGVSGDEALREALRVWG